MGEAKGEQSAFRAVAAVAKQLSCMRPVYVYIGHEQSSVLLCRGWAHAPSLGVGSVAE